MQMLSHVLKQIETETGVVFKAFKHAVPFGQQALFKACNYVGSQGAHSWNALNFYTGEHSVGLSYELDSGEYFDAVVYFVSGDRFSLILALPEAGAGIFFATDVDAMMDFKESEASMLASYQYELDWAKLGERDVEWTRFVYEWKHLPGRYS